MKTVAKKSPSQARHCRIVLNGAMGMAVRHDALSVNPVTGTAPVARKPPDVRALSVEEFQVLRERVSLWQRGLDPISAEPDHLTGRPRPTDLLDVVDLLAATGTRIGEVLAPRWRGVDLDVTPATATIAGTVIQLKGQGYFRQDHPKTKSGWRTVSLPMFAAATLHRLRDQQGGHPGPDDYVLPSAAGTLRSPSNFRRQWRDARDASGFEWVIPRTFRKTVATLLDRERSTKDASQQLGHSGTAVTLQHYIAKAHVAPDNSDVLEALAPPPKTATPEGPAL